MQILPIHAKVSVFELNFHLVPWCRGNASFQSPGTTYHEHHFQRRYFALAKRVCRGRSCTNSTSQITACDLQFISLSDVGLEDDIERPCPKLGISFHMRLFQRSLTNTRPKNGNREYVASQEFQCFQIISGCLPTVLQCPFSGNPLRSTFFRRFVVSAAP